MTDENSKKIKIGEGTVTDGVATIDVNVTGAYNNGQYELVAEYEQNEEYMSSSATGILRVGYKTMAHVPRVYVWENRTNTVDLKANIRIGSYAITGGKGTFRIDGSIIENGELIKVKSGEALKENYDMSNLTLESKVHKCSFKYNGDDSRYYNPAMSNDAPIYFMSLSDRTLCDSSSPEHFTEVYAEDVLVGKPGDSVTVTAVVRDVSYSTSDGEDNNPMNGDGVIKFWYSGQSEGDGVKVAIDDSGYANFTFVIPEIADGTYDFFLKFMSNDTSKWASCYGATSLFVTSYVASLQEPTIVINNFSFNQDEQKGYIQCTFKKPYNVNNDSSIQVLHGSAELWIDDILVTLTNNNLYSGRSIVNNAGQTEFHFDLYGSDGSLPEWVSPGKHHIKIVYYNDISTNKYNQEEYTNTYEFDTDAYLIIRYITSLGLDNLTDDNGILYVSESGESTPLRVSVTNNDKPTDIISGDEHKVYVYYTQNSE